jgi:hypothetical protein
MGHHRVAGGVVVIIALVGLSVLLTGWTITCGVWMRADKRELSNARDTLDGAFKTVSEWEHKYNEQLLIARSSMEQRDREHNLRVIAEASRNAARKRTQELLRKHIRTATDDEIRELTADVFGSAALSVVPDASTEEGGPDDLLRPSFDL